MHSKEEIEKMMNDTGDKIQAIPTVEWENLQNVRFDFKYDDYILSVVKINKRIFWFVDYADKVDGYQMIGYNEPTAKTENEAKLLAELCFVRHLANRIK